MSDEEDALARFDAVSKELVKVLAKHGLNWTTYRSLRAEAAKQVYESGATGIKLGNTYYLGTAKYELTTARQG